jgi:thymidylate kinase
MNPRKEFLLGLFRNLAERQVPYAVVRNYDDIFDNTSTDVDLAVEPEELNRLVQCLAETAVATGHVEVLRARYVNYSYVYFHTSGGFLRIDVETETRWRIFPVLSAKAIVGLRRKHNEFYIPHPRHESAILLTASIWRGFVSERYRTQLSRLFAQLNDPLQLRRSFRAIFGSTGDVLADYQSATNTDPHPPLSFKSIRKVLIYHTLSTGPNRRALFQNLLVDIRRFFHRIVHPPGISLLVTSSAREAWDIRLLLERIDFLYPIDKTELHHLEHLPDGPNSARLTLKLRLQRLRTLFKGGLFIRFYQTHRDDEIPHIIRKHSRYIYPSCTFVCAENSRNEIVLAHVGTGLMAQLKSREEESSRGSQIVRFITGILNRNGNSRRAIKAVSKPAHAQGKFIVLLGLDGSGKTTVARHVCCLVGQMHEFQAVHYFHWRPSLLRQSLFPLSSATNMPRKTALKPNALRSLVSVLRLFKNLVLTKLAWSLNIRKLLRRNSLIIMDRYFYNYYLDPVSVRYYGPTWLVDKMRAAFPKPDWIVVLDAPPATLLARKQELSELEIQKQSAVLQKIASDSPNSIVVDATRSPEEVAREILSRITKPPAPAQQARQPELPDS